MPDCTCHLDPLVICPHHRRIGLAGVARAREALKAAKERNAWRHLAAGDNATAPSDVNTGGGKDEPVSNQPTADLTRPGES